MKKTISIILTLVLLFSALSMTSLTAGAYAGYTQENICTWWDGKDIKFHAVDGAVSYLFYFIRVLPEGETAYSPISYNSLTFEIVDGKPDHFFIDGLANPNFGARNAVKLNDGTFTIRVENWLDAINSNFAYTYYIYARDQNNKEITKIQSDYVSGQGLINGYSSIGGIVKLSGVTDDGEAGTGTWITAEVIDCNIPVSDLRYTWKYYDTKDINHYYELYTPQGYTIPGSGEDTTLRGVDGSYVGKYARLVVTADGYDGAFYSPLFHFSNSLFTVSGTITSFLSDSDSIGVFLKKDDAGMPYMQYRSGNTAVYGFYNVTAGDYTLTITKKNHVSRAYSFSVSDNTTQDAKICPIGDADGNGKVNAADAKAAFQHGNEQKLIDDEYKIKCADVASPTNRVNSADAKAIFQHANEQKSLWTE
ncbi:MAG: hypothetical protein IJH40_01260 [Ruminococcus sp.]|uniref:hypothetical protein n=1 Tax=Ruminococcus sp. TaxID=41978 RepID=UPI002873DA18|nr:hypothetical protein [Ruminococcus sp.]MBQ3284243.1 hypothetical protein [Ruminococcus sp.]